MTDPCGLVIIGASSLGVTVHAVAENLGLSPLVFVDDRKTTSPVEGVRLLVGTQSADTAEILRTSSGIVAIGRTEDRFRISTVLDGRLTPCAAIISPGAHVAAGSTLGVGSIVLPGAVIGPQCQIGAHCIIGSNCTIGACAVIADYVTLGSGCNIGAESTLEAGCHIGMGAVVNPLCRVVGGTKIGSLTAVTKSITAPGVYIGAPAKILR
ncbi:hypothetical protein [Rhodobacter sp. TJ_12]|uniref:PglD-related sugar-binding protein n=1 Tax=Rhodobacter sp. TJ_12 TaxID=2029399 RepID=UPI001CBEC1FE